MQRYTIIFASACCVILVGINLYLNYRLYNLVRREACAAEMPDGAAVFSNTSPSLAGTEAYNPSGVSYGDTSGGGSTKNGSAGIRPTDIIGSLGSPNPAGQGQTETAPAPLYMLGMRDGYIAVFYGTGGGKAVKEVTALSANALPFDEKLRLSQGIPVRDESELAKLLQDYGS